jgi:selenocysteine lyase/cysteine desulfurase
MTPSAIILPARVLFDIPDGVTYLNHAGMAPHLHAVTEAGQRAVRSQSTPWTRSIADWFAPAEELRGLVSQLLGTTADSIALVPSASYGIATAAANLPISAGQTIALIDEEFPSNVYAWRELARNKNARMVTAARAPQESWTDALDRIIDHYTAIVAVTPCHWMDGARLDLDHIATRARAVGASFVIDASQYFGAAPLDLPRLQPDFLVSVGYKWLLGPYGLAYLYASSRWCEQGSPIEHTWLARSGAEQFASAYSTEFRPGARRFDMGEFPQFTLIPMAIAGLRQLHAWGIDRISSTLTELTSAAADHASAAGYSVLPRDQRVPHILGIRLPQLHAAGLPRHGAQPHIAHAQSSSIPTSETPGNTAPVNTTALAHQLAAAGVYTSAPGDALRLAPYLYNSSADFDRFFSVLDEILRR